MRTQGAFSDVYEAAKKYMVDRTDAPTNPVVRCVDNAWILESALVPEPDASLEVSLDAFQDWFYESFKDDNFDPDDYAEEFVQQHSNLDDY